MRRFLKYTKQELWDNKGYFFILVITLAAITFLMELTMQLIIPKDAYEIVSLVVISSDLIVIFFFTVFCSVMISLYGFERAVAMSRSRKYFIASAFTAVTILMAAGFACLFPIALVQQGMRLLFGYGAGIEQPLWMFLKLVPIYTVPLALLTGVAVGMLVGGIIVRFGAKGGWTIWAIWMALSLGLPNIIDYFLEDTLIAPIRTMIDAVVAFGNSVGWGVIWAAAIILVTIVGVLMLRRAPVKNL